jgi:hypothetical protein
MGGSRKRAYLLTVIVDDRTSMTQVELRALAPSANGWAVGRAWRSCCARRGREQAGLNYLDEESGGRGGVEWFRLLGKINKALVGRGGWAVLPRTGERSVPRGGAGAGLAGS